MKRLFPLLFLLLSISAFGQESNSIISSHENDQLVKIVIRTEEKLEDRFIALDNMTIKISGDTTKVYYMNYGDGLVSSVMIPYPVFERFVHFEDKIIGFECKSQPCPHSILIEVGQESRRFPIDILYLEAVSSFMLELEN